MKKIISRTRLSVAVAAGKVTGASGRLFRIGGGATWPGLIARRIDPDILKHTVGSSKAKKIVITGSNGKTTTARMVSALANTAVGKAGRVAHNRTGANLLHGVTAVAVHAANVFGKLDKDVLIFEVDEATMPLVVPEIRPDVVIITNIFRDQLDRFGELYAVARGIDKVLEGLPAEATIILNGNDPQVASLGAWAKARKLYFGLETTEVGTPVPEQSADVIRCIRCNHDLDYKVAYLSHLGLYRCPNCGYTLPKLDVAATQVQLAPDGEGPSTVGLITPDGEMQLRIPLPGLHNVYNAAAAIAAMHAAGLSLASAQTAFDGLKTAFGRMEKITAGDKTIFLSFVKNPTSSNLVLRLIAQHPGRKQLYIAFSRTVVDGEDFAWLWDVDFEELTPQVAQVMCSGNKAEEEALRLKYAGVPAKHITTNPDMEKALNAALAEVQPGGTLHILCGYTPNQQLRRIMQKRGWVKHYWQE